MRIRHKKYTKENLVSLAKESLSIAQLLRKLGLTDNGGSRSHVNKYIRLYEIDVSHFTGQVWNQGEKYRQICPAQPLEEILIERSEYRSTTKLKLRMLKEGLLQNKCQVCQTVDWQERPLTLHLDHINGCPSDNRITNLRLLCPNCHSQTETYSNKRRKSKPILPD